MNNEFMTLSDMISSLDYARTMLLSLALFFWNTSCHCSESSQALNKLKSLGSGRLLSASKWPQVTKQLAKNKSFATIAKEMDRDVRTVKKFVQEPDKVCLC